MHMKGVASAWRNTALMEGRVWGLAPNCATIGMLTLLGCGIVRRFASLSSRGTVQPMIVHL